MKKSWIALVVMVFLIGFWAAKKILDKGTSDVKSKSAKIDSISYWTCPMHPQIHMDHAGECPICHMKLVQVKAQEAQAVETSRSQVQASSDQLALIGIQKQEVERMDLNVSIPVSGRLISPSTVAFQVYESDLRLIKAGLPFTGQSSYSPEGQITGVITSVDSIVDPTSRTVRVVGQVKGSSSLIAETTFSGAVVVKLKDRIGIPESSVLHTGTGDLVYVFGEGNRLTARTVKLGPKSEGFYEVVSGLNPGEFISSGPNFLIDSEAKIRGTSGQAHH